MKLIGEGGVRQVGRRKWECWQFVDDGGRRAQRTRRVDGGKRDALRCLESLRSELSEQVPNGETFAAYAESWALQRRNSGQYGVGTLANDERAVRALCMVVGAERMDALDPALCREALSVVKHDFNASGRTLSNTTMNKLQVAFSAIMQQAADDGLIASNPLSKVKLPRPDTRERKAMDDAQLSALLDALDAQPLDGRVMALYLMCELGLRRGEACAVMDSDVEGGVLRVRFAVKEHDCSIGEPKSPAAVRSLPMTARLAGKVDKWRDVRLEAGIADAPTLCCTMQGGTLWPQKLEWWWNSHREGLGAGGYTLHELRHSNLTKMARLLSPFDLKDWAGWSTLAPASIYVHRDLESLREAVRKVDQCR